MILTDTGPLVALIDLDQADHVRCVATLRVVVGPMMTTWPALTEAMYLLGRGGWRMQDGLWQMIRRRQLVPHDLDYGLLARTYDLMAQYADLPMDLADATLVALAESLGLRQVFTLDSHFRIYRPIGGGSFDVVPDA